MRAAYKIDKPNDMIATITISMTVGEWDRLADQLPEKWPAFDVRSVIKDVVIKARNTVFSEEEND